MSPSLASGHVCPAPAVTLAQLFDLAEAFLVRKQSNRRTITCSVNSICYLLMLLADLVSVPCRLLGPVVTDSLVLSRRSYGQRFQVNSAYLNLCLRFIRLDMIPFVLLNVLAFPTAY